GFLFKNPVMKLTQLNKSIPKENKNEKELEFICKVTSPNSFEKILIFYNFFMMILQIYGKLNTLSYNNSLVDYFGYFFVYIKWGDSNNNIESLKLCYRVHINKIWF